jgi:heme iron utilization protein
MARDETERQAQAGAERGGGAAAVKELLRRERVGVLCTLSLRHPGWPFGTLAPYALSRSGAPLLLLSAVAQHTRNLDADARASLLVAEAAAIARDPRTAPRATLVGRAARVAADEEADARARYLARHPESRGLLSLDFALYVIAVDEAHYVGGFAAAGFFPGTELTEPG